MIFLIQGWLMSAVVKEVEVSGVKVPVIYEKDSSLPLVSLEVIFRNSGSLEDGEHEGLASFTSKIYGEGTKELGSTKFAEILDDNALHLNVNNGNETFVFEASSLKEKFGMLCKMLSKLLKDPNLTDSSFQKVKTMTLGAISSKEDDFDYTASVGLKKLLFAGTPLGHSSLGTKESIEKLKLDDIKNFIQKHIVTSRAIVVIGGDINEEDALKKVKDILSSLKVGSYEKVGFYNASDKQEQKIIKKDTKQAYVYFGAPFYLKVNDKDAYKAKVAAFILGSSGFGSRMMEEIRVKKGLAYSAYARVNLNKSYSDFSGYLQTKVKTKDEAVKSVKEVIDNFIAKGVTQEELKAAKEFLSGSEPLRVETLSQRLNRAFFEYYRGLKLGYSLEELKKIDKLTLKELNDFIKNHKEIKKLSFCIVTK
jgi:predicted Zn-dependent peptidase